MPETTPTFPPGLCDDEEIVNVWHGLFSPASGRSYAATLQCLDAEERRRAARFHHGDDRERFVAAHGFLRSVLAWHAGQQPGAIALSRTPSGKPLAPATGLHFNLSHSHDAFACAVARKPVGIDIEYLRPIPDALTLARRFFSAAEFRTLVRTAPERRLPCFYSCWTRKEAYVKATGEGLALSLQSFTVSTRGRRAVLLNAEPAPSGTPRWHLADLAAHPGYVGAVAVEGKPARIIERWWPAGQ